MNLSLKGGVEIDKLTPQGCLIALIVAGIYYELGLSCTITSGNDPGHMSSSKHYEGNALDFRTRGIHPAVVSRIPALAKMQLGSNFDVVLETKTDEATGEVVQHLHVEYDPKPKPEEAKSV
jgi:hypothetical protein